MISVYRLFYTLLKTLVIVLAPFFGDKVKRWVALRSFVQLKKRDLQLQNTVWIHASSGEIEYAKALIRELKQKSPDQKLVVTYSSESAEKLFENVRSFVDEFLPLPWDDRYSMNLLIKKLQPQALIIARTDLWPEMIFQCARHQIPVAVISYFPKMSGLAKLWLRPILRKTSFISCVDSNVEAWVKPMINSEKTQLQVDGDTRFDQVFIRISQPTKLNIQCQEKIFTFGSTWPEDEAQVKNLISAVLTNNQKVILGPHDISEDHLKDLTDWLEEKKYSYRLLSKSSQPIAFDFQVLLIDQIGYLADAYRFSDFAFVGGSFKARVHSVMEPLACGLPVLVGPHIQNSPEAIRYSKKPKFVHISQNTMDLLYHYKQLNSKELPNLKTEIKLEMQKNKGASLKIVNFILRNFLKKAGS